MKNDAHLQAAIAALGSDPAAHFASLATAGTWPHADSPELAGLERWATDLALADRNAGTALLVATAVELVPRALAAAGADAANFGLTGENYVGDGAPTDTQVARAAALFTDASDAAFAALQAAHDPTRQLHIWSPDMMPSKDAPYLWHTELGQLCTLAFMRPQLEGRPGDESYYEWPAENVVGRGMVVALRGVRTEGESDADRIRALFASLRA